jgi:hypothetical protein
MGAGLLLDRCPYPMPNEQLSKFDTVIGKVLVITHECDVDKSNERMFNDQLVVIPILPLDDWCELMDEDCGLGSWGGILPKIASDDVFRVMYLPPVPRSINTALPSGGLLNLNSIASAQISWFDKYNTMPICSLSGIGLRAFDYKITNHLLRQKAAPLWFSH